MKAATLTSPQEVWKRPLRVGEVARPEPKPGQVLVRVRVCGVCRTDLHIVEGDLPPCRPGVIPGHQIVGEVVAGATEELPVGTRVGVSWMGGTDGTCRYCHLGLENLCDSPTFTGYTWTAAMLNMRSFAPISLFLFPINSTIYTPPRCCAQASLVFAAFVWPASSMATASGCLGSVLRPIWQSRSYVPGTARCTSPREERLIAS